MSGKVILASVSSSLMMVQADTVGIWRFDEAGASDGGSIIAAENLANPGTHDASVLGGSPLYSNDIPAAEIFDPVSGTTYNNEFSLDATAGNSRLSVVNSVDFDRSFTVEFFVKFIGEPASYEAIFQRVETTDLSWKVDFDHGSNLGFGRIRARWDTPAGAPDGVAQAGVDENVNFVVGPQGNATAPKVYIDTGAKDTGGVDVGPQNTGNTNDYVYDAASANPNEVDIALQGDGLNDVDEWHHVAMSLDQETGEVKIYFNYLLSQTRVLSDAEADGYTHPAADLIFGKITGSGYGLLMDEVRYSDAILTPGDFLRAPFDSSVDAIGYWRLEEEGAADGADVLVAENSSSILNSATPNAGTPRYSSDVPSATIFDPVSGTTFTNQFSLDASDANSRLRIANDVSLNSSFTMEFFIKLTGEPGGYHAFVRRSEANDLRWQFDFDHAAIGAFGRMRCRFDTPSAAGPDGVNEAGVDENINFVVGALGGGSIPDSQRIWIDTDSGDSMVSSYDDPSDWALDGDGVNDKDEWHHVAITFDEDTGTIGFYYDYELMQSRVLLDSAGDGYTHPSAPIDFGKLTNSAYDLLLDEVRLSGEVLLPFQFLQAVAPPEASGLEITSIDYESGAGKATIVWNSEAGQTYLIDRSTDLVNWTELVDDELASGSSHTFEDLSPPAGTKRVFYRVRFEP